MVGRGGSGSVGGTVAGRGGRGGSTSNTAANNKNIKTMFDTGGIAKTRSAMSAAGDDSVKKMLEEILHRVDMLSVDMKDVKNQMAEVRNTVRAIVVEEFEEREAKWNGERDVIQKKITELEMREELRSRAEKKNNITIHGFAPKTDQLNSEISNFFREALDVQVDVAQVARIKTKRNSELFIAKFNNQEDKRQVMFSKKKLRGTNISINNDRTNKEREIQRTLTKLAEEEKQKGNEVRIGYQKLFVNGKERLWKEGKGLLDPVYVTPDHSFRQ